MRGRNGRHARIRARGGRSPASWDSASAAGPRNPVAMTLPASQWGAPLRRAQLVVVTAKRGVVSKGRDPSGLFPSRSVGAAARLFAAKARRSSIHCPARFRKPRSMRVSSRRWKPRVKAATAVNPRGATVDRGRGATSPSRENYGGFGSTCPGRIRYAPESAHPPSSPAPTRRAPQRSSRPAS